jgi:hypothetical protein
MDEDEFSTDEYVFDREFDWAEDDLIDEMLEESIEEVYRKMDARAAKYIKNRELLVPANPSVA